MQNITTITLTGADERTPLEGLIRLVSAYPAVEVGLLYTETREGRPRYPSLDWLLAAADALSGRVAIHVCGSAARRRLRDGQLRELTAHAPRVQVNGRIDPDELPLLAQRVGTLITQHARFNERLLAVPVRNHALLIDASGGRGISPSAWDNPQTDKPLGRAGGIGPHNLLAEVEGFSAVARPGAWIDMEGRLRTDDWFDIDLAQQCATIFHMASIAGTAA